MTRTDPRPLLSYTFQDHGGATYLGGKPNWPHVLQVDITRNEAFRLCQSLLVQLADKEESEYDFALVGEMRGPEVAE